MSKFVKTNWWSDITRNQTTGHVVAIDLYKAISFFAGIFYLLVMCPAILVVFKIALQVEIGVTLVGLAFGLQGLKVIRSYFERKTSDGDGNPLVQAGTEQAPQEPVPMPEASAKAEEDVDK